MNEKHPTSHKNNEYYTVLMNVIANMPGHFYWKDTQGVYLGCNDKQAQSLGLESGDKVIGKTDFELPWPSESAKQFRENDLRIMSCGKAEIFEESANVDGKLATVLSIKAPLKDSDGNIQGILGISIDITEQKRLENELRKAKDESESANQAKSYALGLLTDELYMPYQKILENAFQLPLCRTVSDRQEKIEIINESANEGMEILRLVVENAKLTTIDPKLIGYDQFDLKALIEEIVTGNTNWAFSRNIQLIITYPDNTPVWVSGYKLTLRMVLGYLLNIAIAESEKEHVSISALLIKKELDNMDIEISILPQGNALNIEHTLLDTSQSQDTMNIKEKRKYLGLENIKKAADLIKSDLKITAKVGEGLRVFLKMNLPIDTVLPNAQSPWKKYQSNTRVLIVDSEGRGEIIRQYLGSENIDVIPSHNDMENKLLSADLNKNPYNIVIIGRVGKGELQVSRAAKLERDIRKLKIKEQPMLVLLIDKKFLDLRERNHVYNYNALILSTLLPSELQKELTIAWETWLDKINSQ